MCLPISSFNGWKELERLRQKTSKDGTGGEATRKFNDAMGKFLTSLQGLKIKCKHLNEHHVL